MVGALAVGLGAFGAHGLQKVVTDAKSIKVLLPPQTNPSIRIPYHSLPLLLLQYVC